MANFHAANTYFTPSYPELYRRDFNPLPSFESSMGSYGNQRYQASPSNSSYDVFHDQGRREIRSFKQKEGENFYEVWERFENLLRTYPKHEFKQWEQTTIFYNGLKSIHKSLLDRASCDYFDELPGCEALNLIRTQARKDYHACMERREVNAPMTDLHSKVDALTNQVLGMVQNSQPAAIQYCYYCGGGHRSEDCLRGREDPLNQPFEYDKKAFPHVAYVDSSPPPPENLYSQGMPSWFVNDMDTRMQALEEKFKQFINATIAKTEVVSSSYTDLDFEDSIIFESEGLLNGNDEEQEASYTLDEQIEESFMAADLDVQEQVERLVDENEEVEEQAEKLIMDEIGEEERTCVESFRVETEISPINLSLMEVKKDINAEKLNQFFKMFKQPHFHPPLVGFSIIPRCEEFVIKLITNKRNLKDLLKRALISMCFMINHNQVLINKKKEILTKATKLHYVKKKRWSSPFKPCFEPEGKPNPELLKHLATNSKADERVP